MLSEESERSLNTTTTQFVIIGVIRFPGKICAKWWRWIMDSKNIISFRMRFIGRLTEDIDETEFDD